MRNFLGLLLFLLCFAWGCNMHQNMDIELPAHEPVTLIECYLTPGHGLRATATRSLRFFDKLEVAAADDLSLWVYHQGREIPLPNGLYVDSARQTAYNYFSLQDTVHYAEGDSWQLLVRRGEEEIARATTRFLPRPVIKEISYQLSADSVISLSISLQDNPAQQNYYRVMLFQGGSPPWGQFDGVWTDQFAEDGLLTLHIGPHVKLWGDWLDVRIDHVDEGYYNFLNSLGKASSANYNPFAQPANIESNLEGKVFGVFTAISRTTERIYVDHSR
jgi:hypothetical protein